ncbi:protein ABHD11-like [Stegodyphus dumicola]|uniref:protein ABHD11-like n=1 Tax=Stegodyphus dumicola TaxID=202533 RepID=UPI0015A7DF6B|nr:protein ABHD11-like [Stegodyphus dumicola]
MAGCVPVELAYKVIEPLGAATDKAPIIFLHGVGDSKEYWADVSQIVANSTRRKPDVEKLKANKQIAGDLKLNPDGRYGFKRNLKVLLKAMRNATTVMEEPSGVYNGPTYFIYGALSHLSVGADKDHIKQFFPRAEFTEIDDAGHDVHIDQPLHFTKTVTEFISQNENLS